MEEEFDIFICYFEAGATDFANAAYHSLTEEGYKVYVNHIFRDRQSGKFRKNIDEIIRKSKIFILLNTYRALDRKEIIREAKVAFASGSIQQEFWIFREIGRYDVPLVTENFRKETSINLEEYHQDGFESTSDLVRLILRKCADRKPGKREETTVVLSGIPFRPIELTPIKTKLEDSTDGVSEEILHLRKLAGSELHNGNWEGAKELYTKIIDVDKLNAPALNALGIISAKQKNYQEADTYLTEATLANERLSSGWNNRSASAYYQGKYHEALVFINKALELDKRDVDFINLRGSILFALQQYSEAKKCYEESLQIQPDYSKTLINMSSAEYKLGNRESAVNLLRKALDKDEKNEEAWYNLGVIFFEDGKFDEALSCFDRSIEFNSKNPGSYNYKGIIYRKQGKYEAALKVYDVGIGLDLSNPEHYNNKGIALGFMGRHNESLEYFNKALSLNPAHLNSRLNKAVAWFYLGNVDRTLTEVKSILEIDGNNLLALKMLAALFEKKELYDRSEVIFEKILKLDHKNLEIRIGSLENLRRQRKYDKALALTQESIQLYPSDNFLKAFLCGILIKLGKLELALSECNKLISQDPMNAGAYYDKACVMARLGKVEQAVLFLRDAINIDSQFRENAKTDEDFKSISNEPEFISLIFREKI